MQMEEQCSPTFKYIIIVNITVTKRTTNKIQNVCKKPDHYNIDIT